MDKVVFPGMTFAEVLIELLLIIIVGFIVARLLHKRHLSLVIKRLGEVCFIANRPFTIEWVVFFFSLSKKDTISLYRSIYGILADHNVKFIEGWTDNSWRLDTLDTVISTCFAEGKNNG